MTAEPGPNPVPPRPSPGLRERTGRRRGWRLATPLVVLLSGALFVVSAENSEGTDLRPGRYTDLAGLVAAQSRDVEELTDRAAALQAEITRLGQGLGGVDVRRVQRRAARLRADAGLRPVHGPGLTVTLSDAPPEVRSSSRQEPNLLVVHQQDIQAVVNAMWKGGARAVTLQGQRIISTTGIKCEGNAVMLQGVPYSQPYVVSAVGDPTDLVEAVLADDYLGFYRAQAAIADIGVGWNVEVEDSLTAPAYDGLLDLTFAQPLRPVVNAPPNPAHPS